MFKAEFVIQGHRDKENESLVHDFRTMRQSTIVTIIMTAVAES